MNKEIWFYDTKDKPYGVFSNFYLINIKYGNKTYPTSEAYFQAEKYKGVGASKINIEYAKLIESQNTGNKAAILARQVVPNVPYKWATELRVIVNNYKEKGVKIRGDWESIKDNVMRRAVYQKFSQHSNLKEILLQTEDKLIFEHTHRDLYWADGHPKSNSNVHGEGKNMLGIILEETRYMLGGKLSNRFSHMLTFEYSHFVIPGMFLVTGAPNKYHFDKMKENGFKYFISLMEEDEEIDRLKTPYHDAKFTGDFCTYKDGVILSRYSIKDREITDDEKALDIACTILIAIAHKLPTVLHCWGGKGRSGVIIAIVIGLLYDIDSDTALKITDRLFKTHRQNQGDKGKKMPQTKVQFDQVKRVLQSNIYEHYNL